MHDLPLANMRNALPIFALLVGVLGCDGPGEATGPTTGPTGNVVFRDTAGNEVATANVRLPEALPAEGQRFEGRWQPISAEPGFPAGGAERRASEGSVLGDGVVSINLNPGHADDNVVFAGSTATEPITGTWVHLTYSGPVPLGTFVLSRRSGAVC